MILREIKNIFIKNRLTEGVDYKRYEWLKGDGSASIDTTIYDLDSIHTIDVIFNPSKSFEQTFARGANILNQRFAIQYSKSARVLAIYTSNYYEFTNVSTDNGIVHITFDLDNSRVTDGTKTLAISGFKNQNSTLPLRLSSTGIKSFIIDNKINLTPCQLLKSIPATLDANNRTRQAGECGMYDSISGKFYGNVANTGTFTVEGDVTPETNSGLQQIYQNKLIEGVDYETADWLKGDGTAYIDTLLKPSSSLETQIKFVFSYGLESIPRNTGVFGSCVKEPGWKSAYSRYWINYDNKLEIGYGDYVNTGYITESGQINEIDFNYIEDNVHKFRINNEVYTVSGSPNSTINMLLFGKNIGGYDITTSKINISYCRFIESNITIAEFIPCQLLRSIPRNLDAQCKERVAGECGMIDIISGKFYGNVASSGTFTVENDNNE